MANLDIDSTTSRLQMAIQTEWQSTSQYITSEIFKIVGTVVSGKTEWHFQEILYTSSKPPPL